MDLQKLENILTEKSGNKFCVICGTPFEPYHTKQKTCGAPECQKALHAEYMRERAKRKKEEDIEAWRKYHREAQKKSRHKKKKRIKRDEQLKRTAKRWQKQEDLDRKVKEYGLNYGEVQAQKILEKVPKIDVTLGGDKK